MLIIQVLYQFGSIFIICEAGEQLISIFFRIDDSFEQLKWYRFPIDVQRLLPLITVNTQQEVTVACFGSFSCSRETFKKVDNDYAILIHMKISPINVNMLIKD